MQPLWICTFLWTIKTSIKVTNNCRHPQALRICMLFSYIIFKLFRTNHLLSSEVYLDCRHKVLQQDTFLSILPTKDLRTWIWIGAPSQHPARIIRSLGRNKLYGSVYRVLDFEDGNRAVNTLREKEKHWRKSFICMALHQKDMSRVLFFPPCCTTLHLMGLQRLGKSLEKLPRCSILCQTFGIIWHTLIHVPLNFRQSQN